MLRPEGFGSPFIGVLCAGSPSSPRAKVEPEQKTKRGKGNDRWGRDVVEKDQGKGATGYRNSGRCRKRSQGCKQHGVVGEAQVEKMQPSVRVMRAGFIGYPGS
jgi:hypothetical protein